MSVRVEPVTREWAEALAEGDAAFAAWHGIVVEPGWMDVPEVLPRLIAGALRGGPDPWGWHLVVDDAGALIGNCGWKGEPVDGVAELGYAIAPARRNRGVATAVVRTLLQRATQAGLRTAVAHTLAEESASTTVLRRCGFARVGDVVDPQQGTVWRWEVSLARA